MIIMICDRFWWFEMPLEGLGCVWDTCGIAWVVSVWAGLELFWYWLGVAWDGLVLSGYG